ncbi:MAG: hypothetical protein HYV14_03470 [Elusimicrobia bacterium]|nr:hypothetical protein [Elusimicrobiota bacterium]
MRTMTPPHLTHSTGLTSKTFFRHAAHARAEARTAWRAARSTFPNTVTK